MTQEDYFRRYWDSGAGSEASDPRKTDEAIAELQRQIQDVEVRMEWHAKSLEGGNRLRGYIQQIIASEKLKKAALHRALDKLLSHAQGDGIAEKMDNPPRR